MIDPAALLGIKNLSKSYRAGGLLSRRMVPAVRNIDLHMPAEPSILAVVGESGSGKSTLAKMILRQERQTAGGIYLRDKAIFALGEPAIPDRELRRKVQAIAQSPFDAFSAHLPVDYYLRRTAINLRGLQQKDEIDAAVDVALTSVGLTFSRVAGKYAHQFSGGELQRVSIARALIPDPILIVADEPVSMVDASVRMNIINLFRELMTSTGVSFLYITHDLATAFYVADQLIIMKSGQIVERGNPQDIIAAPTHDYSRLLVSSVPQIGEKWEELAS